MTMPLAFGKDQWFAWDVAGKTGWKFGGGITGGGPRDGFTRRRRAWIGGRKVSVPGRNTLGGSVSFDATADSVAMMDQGLPVAGVLPATYFSGDTGYRTWVHEACVVSRLGWQLSEGGCLQGEISWLSLPPYSLVAAPAKEPTPSSTSTFEDWACSLELDGVGTYEVVEVSIVQDNIASFWNSIKARSAGSLRNADWIVYGTPECTAEMTLAIPPTVDFMEDCPEAAGTLVITADAPCEEGAKTLTITVPNLAWSPPPEEAYMPDETGVIVWRCALEQSTAAAMSWTFA